VGKIIAPFLIRFAEHPAHDVDQELWVIVGDLPSAYFVTDEASTPREAVELYCSLMDDWIAAVLNGDRLDEVFPVEAEPTPGNAESLASRLQFIREQIIPGL
jgi:hypothetical protein